MAEAEPSARMKFIRRTYIHLALAIMAFIGLEGLLLSIPAVVNTAMAIANTSWLLVLGGFMVVGFVARLFAKNTQSLPAQYFGLALYVVAEALIFVPLLAYAIMYTDGVAVIGQAGLVTLLLLGGLTATVFITGKDFSFLKSILVVGGFIALGTIVAGILLGFNLGLWFSVAMVVFAAGAILYTTSNILHHYGEDQYVAAALELFAAVALLFWYVVRIFMSRE